MKVQCFDRYTHTHVPPRTNHTSLTRTKLIIRPGIRPARDGGDGVRDEQGLSTNEQRQSRAIAKNHVHLSALFLLLYLLCLRPPTSARIRIYIFYSPHFWVPAFSRDNCCYRWILVYSYFIHCYYYHFKKKETGLRRQPGRQFELQVSSFKIRVEKLLVLFFVGLGWLDLAFWHLLSCHVILRWGPLVLWFCFNHWHRSRHPHIGKASWF
ncbi:hypothetical protein B0J18DRAFT_196766 [Chaetomium sp. MPI-SDFR-AT-0129]|nr:hypothetical protein B0J18DRAFT_196766 [Chaetomium sp. MPI-SDFR-AT-0129]